MRTTKTTPVSSSADTVTLPIGWECLTDEQLSYICTLSASGQFAAEEVKTHFLLRLAQAQGVHRERIDAIAAADAVSALDWMDNMPPVPVRLASIEGCHPVDSMLNGVPFRQYLALENYYQGYLLTQDSAALDAIGGILYPDVPRTLTAAERYSLLLWMVGLRSQYAQLFPDLFRSSACEMGDTDQREIMNAEIRALTGGDITKIEAVLNANTLDALTELDAKAREARELDEKMKR